MKDMNAGCLQRGTEAASGLARALDDAIHSMGKQGDGTHQGQKGLKPIMESLRGVFESDEQPDTNLLKRLGDS